MTFSFYNFSVKIYFVGLGGIGISGLAQLCQSLGYDISGSNLGRTKIFDILEQKNIKIYDTHHADFLMENTDLLVYSEAIPQNNPERQKAQKLHIPEKTYFEYLGEISQNFKTIAVAGTHGKTTTTGLIASGLIKSGINFTALVGSTLKEFGDNNFYESKAHSSIFSESRESETLGQKNSKEKSLLLVEACEYRNNFQFLKPEIVILTNVELDHVDFYKDENHYFKTFENFCKKSQTVIFHEKDKNSKHVLKNFSGEKIGINFENFNKLKNLSLSGLHNRQNASLALILGRKISENKNLLPEENTKKFLENYTSGVLEFSGAGRRQEFLGEILIRDKKINIFDDYGHHPTEIKVTLQSFREKFPNQKIGLIFEPHQYSRTKEFFKEFLESFKIADFVGIYPIYEARDTAEDIASISRKDFVKENKNINLVNNTTDVLRFTKNLRSGDILLFMGAGNISGLAHKFLEEN